MNFEYPMPSKDPGEGNVAYVQKAFLDLRDKLFQVICTDAFGLDVDLVPKCPERAECEKKLEEAFSWAIKGLMRQPFNRKETDPRGSVGGITSSMKEETSPQTRSLPSRDELLEDTAIREIVTVKGLREVVEQHHANLAKLDPEGVLVSRLHHLCPKSLIGRLSKIESLKSIRGQVLAITVSEKRAGENPKGCALVLLIEHRSGKLESIFVEAE